MAEFTLPPMPAKDHWCAAERPAVENSRYELAPLSLEERYKRPWLRFSPRLFAAAMALAKAHGCHADWELSRGIHGRDIPDLLKGLRAGLEQVQRGRPGSPYDSFRAEQEQGYLARLIEWTAHQLGGFIVMERH